jgi:hypothetical protein
MFDPDNDTGWRKRAIALEYWLMSTLMLGALVYGIAIGISDLLG